MPEIVRVQTQRHGWGRYCARKVWIVLGREGVVVARCTVARLMREAGLVGVTRGAHRHTTRRDRSAVRPPDLVDRQFQADAPNQLWVVDFTYVSTWQQTAYTALVIDVYSRRIVGWRCARRCRPSSRSTRSRWRCLPAPAQARTSAASCTTPTPAPCTSIRYTTRLADAGALASIGSIGDSYDNALAETTIGLYKTECVHFDAPWQTVEELELATLVWVDWWNTIRLHSSIGDIPPIEYEQRYHEQARQQPLPGTPSAH